MTKADTAHLQAFHMRCQRRILGVRWFDKVKNAEKTCCTGLSHLGQIIQRRRYSLFDHIAHMDPSTPTQMALKLRRDILMGRRVSAGWRRPR